MREADTFTENLFTMRRLVNYVLNFVHCNYEVRH